jgi:proteasome lid subunit RPN8/RPN11
MDDSIVAALRAHAAREAPRECCGLVVRIGKKDIYRPCRNIAGDDAEFAIAPEDWAAAEDAGEIVTVCHSHPFASAEPSPADRSMCEVTGLAWLIASHPSGEVRAIVPEGYRAPLVGRRFVHGVHDCYSLIRDYYAWEIGITLPDFERAERWWEHGADLYRAGFAAAGFAPVEMSALQPHDVILMQVRAAVPNHGAVYVGEGKILQHLMTKLSGRTIYGGWYQRCTTHILRHASLR